jgi:hypothetical protein
MELPGRTYTSTNQYRYGYQGSEKDRELNTNTYTTFFREIDTRIVRWWSYDPKPNPSSSPYVAMGNNPIWYNDIMGDIIKGATKQDAKDAVSDIQSTLKGDKFSKVRELIKVGKDKKTLDKVNCKALNEALKGQKLNADEMSLVFGIVGTLNSKDEHEVSFVKNSDLLSADQEKIFLKGFPALLLDPIREKNNGIPFWLLSGGFTGSGATVPTDKGTYSLLISDVPDKGKTDYYNKDTKGYVSAPGGRPSTFAHEVFGHGRSLALGRITSQHIDAVQTENLVLRVMGFTNVQRDGTNHGDFSQIGKPSEIPAFMDIRQLFLGLMRF